MLHAMTFSPSELLRYGRHLALPEVGLAGQEKLKAARVLVIGAGGLGSPCALYLAAAGVGTLGLVDHDRVDESNLQRQVLFDTAGIGAPKAELARRRLSALNPQLDIIAHALELHAGNVEALLRDYQLIIDGSDRVSTRYLVNDACVLYGKPLISAAIHRFEGQAMTYVPGRSPCYRCLFPEPAEGLVPSCAQAGVLGMLPGVLGCLQATEAIKLIVGIGEPLTGRLLTYDALALRFDEFRFARRSNCAVCGEAPSIRAPQDPPGFCTLEELARVPQNLSRRACHTAHEWTHRRADRCARAARVQCRPSSPGGQHPVAAARGGRCVRTLLARGPRGADRRPVGIHLPQRCAQPQGLRARAARGPQGERATRGWAAVVAGGDRTLARARGLRLSLYALAIHGGAGTLQRTLSPEREAEYRHGLAAALNAGQRILEADGTALDAVEAAVSALEDHPLFNAGRGAVLTHDGTVELDAAIMDGATLRAGAVAQLRHVRNPVQLARRLLERSPHVFLVGDGAERLATEWGFSLLDQGYFITDARRAQLEALQERPDTRAAPAATLDEPPFGTVGAVARDRAGHLAAATSTGGLAGKHSGRVGDSPVIGAGTYADDRSCAVSTTGHGEWFLRTVQAYDIAARLHYGGQCLRAAVEDAVLVRLRALGAAGGLIAVGADGQLATCFNTGAMFRATVRGGESAQIEVR